MPAYPFDDKNDNFTLFLTLCNFLWVLGAQTVHVLRLILAVVILLLCTHNADTLNICLKKFDACIIIL